MSPKVVVLLKFSLFCIDCRSERLRKWLMYVQIRPGGTLDRVMKLVMLNLARPWGKAR